MNPANALRATRPGEPFSSYPLLPPLSKWTTSAENTHAGEKTYFNTEGTNVTKPQNNQASFSLKPRKIKAKFKPNYEKLIEKTKTKNKLCVLFRSIGESSLANKMRDCSNFFYALTTGQCIARTEETFHCSSRHCPFCSALKAQRKIDDYLPKAESFYSKNASVTPVHLILTQKHRKNEALSDSVQRLLSSFRKLIRRKFWKNHCEDGGIYSVEFTIGRDGNWHTHLHCLVFRRRYFDVRPFRKEWLSVTSDSVNFKVVPIDTLSGGIEEIIGYIGKPSDVAKFTAHHARQLLDLKDVRLFGTFGTFRTFCASFEHSTCEMDQPGELLSEGDLCECHKLPLHRVRLDIKNRIELERQIYLTRQHERQKPKHNLMI